MASAERQRTAGETPASLPDLPPGLFGEEPNGPRSKQASGSAESFLDFLKPPSPGRNAAEIGLDSLWSVPEQPRGYGALPPPNAPIPGLEPLEPPTANEDQLSGLWSTEPSADPELESLWDTPSRSATADDAGDALSNLFMNRDAVAQAELTGQPTDYGDIPQTRTASSSRGNEFTIEFDAEFNFDGPVRTGGVSGPRFRVDQAPPARRPFESRVSSQVDGVVVGRRGNNGRFQVAPVRPPATVAQVRSEFHARALDSRASQVARYEAKAAQQPAPAPAAAPSTTAYDVIRRGGLDL